MSENEDGRTPQPEKVGLDDEDREMIESMFEDAGLGSDPGSRARSEVSTTANIDEADDTLQKVHKRFVEILSSIEDSLKGAEAAIDEKMEQVMAIITKELQNLGLGVFATRAATTVKTRLRENLHAAEQLSTVIQTLKEARERLDTMVLTTSSGLTLQVFQTASQQQDRLVQLYAKLNELDKQLESTSAEVRIWRSRASEQEEVVRLKDEALEQSTKNLEDLRTVLSEIRSTLEEKNAEITELKGKVGQAEIQIGEQKGLLSQVDTSAELVQQYESRVEELAMVRGQIMVLEDKLHQRDAAVDLLKKEIRELEELKSSLETKIETMNYESAEWKGLKDTQAAEIESLRAKVQEMETRWDALYQIAEDEPAFKAYFIIAGKTNWLPLQHLSSALGIPTILLKRQMQKFIDAGLVEFKEDKIRSRTLSGVDEQPSDESDNEKDIESDT